MGYLLKTLGNLPVQDNVNIYIFAIGGSWDGGLIDVINKNYLKIADAIGEDAIIVKGFNEEFFGEEVAQKYLGFSTRDDRIWKLLPSILITDSHPDHLTDESLRILFPLNKIEANFASVDQFLSQLVAFARNGDEEFLRNIKETNSLLEVANEVVSLQPNFFGVGLNLNNLIDRFISRR